MKTTTFLLSLAALLVLAGCTQDRQDADTDRDLSFAIRGTVVDVLDTDPDDDDQPDSDRTALSIRVATVEDPVDDCAIDDDAVVVVVWNTSTDDDELEGDQVRVTGDVVADADCLFVADSVEQAEASPGPTVTTTETATETATPSPTETDDDGTGVETDATVSP